MLAAANVPITQLCNNNIPFSIGPNILIKKVKYWQASFTYDYKNAAVNKWVLSPILKLANEDAVFTIDGSVS